MLTRLLHAAAYPEPYRARIVRSIVRRLRIGSYAARLEIEAVDRPWYGWCLYGAALQARALGYRAISVAEMGVAGGNGLLNLCDHAAEITHLTGVSIAIFGFDSASGLPPSQDYRDLPYVWPAGSFAMDVARLKNRLGTRATLKIGDVRDTVPGFRTDPSAPLGAVMFDLDMYSSTAAALAILDVPERIPRVWCWFDDIIGYIDNLYCERNGERAAIADYNRARSDAFLSPANCSFGQMAPRYWHQQIYVDHRFQHPAYSHCLSSGRHELALD